MDMQYTFGSRVQKLFESRGWDLGDPPDVKVIVLAMFIDSLSPSEDYEIIDEYREGFERTNLETPGPYGISIVPTLRGIRVVWVIRATSVDIGRL